MPTHPWERHLAANRDAHYAEFLDLLRIPSVSTDPDRTADVARAADWVAERLRRAGVPDVEQITGNGHPVVLGRWHDAPGKPTVLVYGHYDVQPVDPLNLWESPPFEPTERDGMLVARGSSDMKGNLVTLVQAVEALAHAGNGAPPVNLTFLFEGEEEVGSPHLPQVIETYRDRLACDFVLSADGGMGGPDTPVLAVGLKGICALQIDVRTSSTDLHSGGYGAVVPNAVQVLTQLAASFHTPDGRVAVEGFYDDVRPLTDEDRAEIAASAVSDEELVREAGVLHLAGEPGFTPAERRGSRPTLDFNGIWGGFQGEGTKTVTPCEAHLKITCRLVVDQTPAKIIELISRHVDRHAPSGAAVSVVVQEAGALPYVLRRETPALQVAKRVLTEMYGKEPLAVRVGGSVPVTEVFQRVLGVDTITIGFGLPGSKAHAPNEWYLISQFDLARRTYAAYLEALGS